MVRACRQRVRAAKTKRWLDLLELIETAGTYGKQLVTRVQATNRKGKLQTQLHVLRFDWERYHSSFLDNVFGSLVSYKFHERPAFDVQSQAVSVDLRALPHQSSVVEATAIEIVNLKAWITRHEQGASVTHERRPEDLEAAIRYVRQHGLPIKFDKGVLVDCPNSQFYATLREYVVLDGFGRLYQRGRGVQMSHVKRELTDSLGCV